MFPVIIGLVALFALAAAAEAKPSKPTEPAALPPELAASFEHIGGQLVYRAEIAAATIAALLYRTATPPADEAPNVMIISPGPGTPLGPEQWGAYWAVKGLHDEGWDIWVPTTAHLPVAVPYAAVYLRPGQGAQAQYAGYALLISASHTWPEATA